MWLRFNLEKVCTTLPDSMATTLPVNWDFPLMRRSLNTSAADVLGVQQENLAGQLVSRLPDLPIARRPTDRKYLTTLR